MHKLTSDKLIRKNNSMVTRRNFFKKAGAAGLGMFLFNDYSLASKHFGAQTEASAFKSINEYRMCETSIRLISRNGKPVRNKTVNVALQKHAFLFGDCNPKMDSMFRQGDAASEKLKVYRKIFASVMNAVNATCYWSERPRNNMAKTEAYRGEIMLDGFNNTVDWGLANGLTVKGHPLFWTVPKAIPEWISAYDYATRLKFLEVRLRSIVGRYKGRVTLWDAINEMLWEPAFKNLSKRTWPYTETVENMVEYISFVLKICREEDPDAHYLLNDYGLEKNHNEPALLSANDNDITAIKANKLFDQYQKEVTAAGQRKRYLELVKRLSDLGYPPAGIGMQGHSGAVSKEQQLALYDEMSVAGLPLHITEFWANENDFGPEFKKMDEKEQQERIAAYVRQYMVNAFSHPAIDSFFFWEFMGMAVDFKPGNSPSYEELPTFRVVKDLIKKEWNTNEMLTTNSDGILTFKGYYGDYSLRYGLMNDDNRNMGIKFCVSKNNSSPLTLKTLIID